MKIHFVEGTSTKFCFENKGYDRFLIHTSSHLDDPEPSQILAGLK